MTTDTDLRTSIGITGRIDTVPADLALHAQAVLREAATNTARHAHATELTVTITVGADLLIDVTDNGTGIPVTVARGGLHNLAARAAAAGGRSTIDQPGGGGTRLVAAGAPGWSGPPPALTLCPRTPRQSPPPTPERMKRVRGENVDPADEPRPRESWCWPPPGTWTSPVTAAPLGVRVCRPGPPG